MVNPWLAEHAAGLTPTPACAGTGSVRLDVMLDLAERLGCGTLTTGHYAAHPRRTGRRRPAAADGGDPAKDQSYALAALAPRLARAAAVPAGRACTKPQVRDDRRTPDCRSPASATRRTCASWPGWAAASVPRPPRRPARRAPGPIVDRDGRLGEHAAAHRHRRAAPWPGLRTGPGQRRAPMYVLGDRPHSNTVTVGTRDQLLTRAVSRRRRDVHRHGTV